MNTFHEGNLILFTICLFLKLSTQSSYSFFCCSYILWMKLVRGNNKIYGVKDYAVVQGKTVQGKVQIFHQPFPELETTIQFLRKLAILNPWPARSKKFTFFLGKLETIQFTPKLFTELQYHNKTPQSNFCSSNLVSSK